MSCETDASKTAHGTFVWNELGTRDLEAAKRFYGATLGWSFKPMEMGGYTYHIAMSGEAEVAGLFELKGPEFDSVPAHWLAYIAVDDVDARLDKLAAAGGEVVRPAFDVPGVGRIAIVRDAEGAFVGWMTPIM